MSILAHFLVAFCLHVPNCAALGVLSNPPSINPVTTVNKLSPLSQYINTFNLPYISHVPFGESIKEQYDLGLNNEEKYMNFTQLARKYGRKVSTHEVETGDGYLLTMFQLHGSGDPLVLVHGLLSSPDDFITPGPESSIAYLLNDEDYDVWLPQLRGGKYSRRHVSLSPDTDAARFWNFSWHEMGTKDLPVIIDYVLLNTNSSTVKYVGHSQGATSFFVMCSERPEYNKKISLQVSLSAPVFMSHTISPFFRLFSLDSPVFNTTAGLIGLYEFIPDYALVKTLSGSLCGNVVLASTICTQVTFFIGGINYGQLNFTNLPVIFNHEPSPSSTKQVLHYAQLVTSGGFHKIDYGDRNNQVYGSSEPPEYALDHVTAPVAIIWGDGDWVSTFPDIAKLAGRLPKVEEVFRVEYPNFNHFDLIWAKDMKELIMDKLLYLLSKY